MDKSQMGFQIVKLSLIAALLLITPLVSTSMRTPYLYFLTNLLIIALGAEAGLLPTFSNHAEEKKPATVVTPKPISSVDEVCELNNTANPNTVDCHESPECTGQKPKAVEKIVNVVEVCKVKKSPSTPSLFFIGGSDPKEEQWKGDEEEEEDEAGCLSGRELFTRAETFIGNFYKQLKIQREDSWKSIHEFCENGL